MAKAKVEKQSFEDVMKSLEKTYGKGTIINFQEAPQEKYDIIPTGSIAIDNEVLGIGGFAKGKLYLIKGWNGSNKTTLCGTVTSNCQKTGGKIGYLDYEMAVDVSYFKKLGVNFDSSFYLIQPDNFEAGVDIALQLINTGELDLLIIDSDSAGLPKSMMEAEIGSQFIGKKAKANSENYPKLKIAAHKNNTCILTIAQYRIDPGQMFGDNRTIPGGKSLEYYADCIIELTKKLKKEGDETSGTITTIKTQKNKTYLPFRENSFPTTFGIGIDYIEELIDYCNKFEVFRKYGGTITYQETKYPLEEFYQMIQDNPEFQSELRDKVINKLKGEINENTN